MRYACILTPVLIKFIAKFLQKDATPYFETLLMVENKTVKYLPKYGGNLHGKRNMCMQHILKKCRNSNCSFLSCTGKIIGFTIFRQFIHIDFTRYGLHLEAWCIRHSGASSSRKQSQDGELTAKQCRSQKTLLRGKTSSRSTARGGDRKYGTITRTSN